jgi:hypothetical protein
LKDLLQAFYLSKNVAPPGVCYGATDGAAARDGDKSKDKGFQSKFIIATPLTTVFPELSGSIFSWLQPGLNSLK